MINNEEYKIEKINEWKYKSHLIPHLDVFILVQVEMRDIQGGEAIALLQTLEADKNKQKKCWQSIFKKD